MTDDELIERMVQEAAELGPIGPAEFERETEVIRASASLARAQKEGDPNPAGGSIGGPAEASG